VQIGLLRNVGGNEFKSIADIVGTVEVEPGVVRGTGATTALLGCRAKLALSMLRAAACDTPGL
jgi:hypothetical protein